MLKKILAQVLLLAMISVVLSGCGSVRQSTDSINVIMGEEPSTIDPGLNETLDAGTYILHAFEGLTRVDGKGKTAAGMALKWDISADGLKYVFHLRDALWSDGQPVRAQDFEYAWKRALSPELASPYSFQLWYIKNGAQYTEGSAKPEDVGVKALDDKTLEVVLSNPTPYFIDLMHYPTYMPLRKDIIDKYGDQWTQNPQTYVTNGAYVMEKWVHESELVFTKNSNYWDKNSISIKDIHWKLTSDNSAGLSAFEAGEVDINDRIFPPEETQSLIKAGTAKVYPAVGNYYILFNVDSEPLKDARVRKALALAIDREYIVRNVTMAGELPADAVVPPHVPGLNPKKDFRSEGISALPKNGDTAQAKKLLADAGYPDGKGFPDIEACYNVAGANKAIIETIMEMWKKNLGITVKAPTTEWKVLLEKLQNKDFLIARMGMNGDYNDPMTFLDIWTSDSTQNNTNWKNPKYDEAIKTAKASNDQKVRMSAMHEAERIFMEDMPAMPVYYNVTVLLENPKVRGHIMDTLGFLYLHHAYIK